MFQPNSVIAGRYQVVRLVGQGGMSNLYLAYDRKYSNATVVVKEMTASYADPKEQQMAVDLFHREAKLLASLNHRHIPKVFDYFQFAGKYYLSMEYIDGVDLAVKLENKKGPLEEKKVLEWGMQIAQVLFYLHKHEPPIVFRDVKPSNIMMSSQGVKLIDFGIARHFDQAKKGDTMRIGSPGYAPPEQYAAQTDPRSDIYALGVTLHHALTGRDPTTTSTPFLVPPARSLNPKLSEATEAVLTRATQLDPADRYQSALEFKKDLQKVLTRGSQATQVVGAAPKAPPQAQPKPTGSGTASTTNPPAVQKKSNSKHPAPQTAPPVTVAQSSQVAQPSTNSANAQSPPPGSGSTGSPSGPLPPKQPPAKKKKKSLLKTLLVAGVFLTACGLSAAFFMEPARSKAIFQQITEYGESLMEGYKAGKEPENRLRKSLLSGDPQALLPLFQSSDFQQLSPEKQELFRLNLLAAGTSDGSFKVIHVLVEEELFDVKVWETAALLARSVNGRGGVNKELLVILPKPFKAGTLAQHLKDSSNSEKSQSFLVIGGQGESLPDSLPENVILFNSERASKASTIESWPSDKTPYHKIFLKSLEPQSILWGIPGTEPEGVSISPIKLETPLQPENLEKMLREAKKKQKELILRASDAVNLESTRSSARVHLLAADTSKLPKLPSHLEGRASVLSSPFEDPQPSETLTHTNSALQDLSLSKARLFDALALAAVGPRENYLGLTIKRSSSGVYEEKRPIRFAWNGQDWLPQNQKPGKKS